MPVEREKADSGSQRRQVRERRKRKQEAEGVLLGRATLTALPQSWLIPVLPGGLDLAFIPLGRCPSLLDSRHSPFVGYLHTFPQTFSVPTFLVYTSPLRYLVQFDAV